LKQPETALYFIYKQFQVVSILFDSVAISFD